MQEFIILIIVILMPDGRSGVRARPTADYMECNYMADVAEQELPEVYPGAEIRTACASSEYVRRNSA